MDIAAICNDASTEVIRLELNRILTSRAFSKSTRLCKFLHFTVEYTIAGKADLLKEYLIGCEVYGRRPPYDPAQDSIVRSEARRLRNKQSNTMRRKVSVIQSEFTLTWVDMYPHLYTLLRSKKRTPWPL